MIVAGLYLLVTFPLGLIKGQHVLLNLEPYPDSFGYLTPVDNFIKGKGFEYSYQDHVIPQRMPPLYSLVLLPLYVVFSSPISFYFTNIILGLLTIIGLFLLIKLFVKDNLIIAGLLMLYLLHGYVLFIVSTPMAENLTLTLFVWALYLFFIEKHNVYQTLLVSFLIVGLLLTKYVYVGVGLVLGMLFVFKYWRQRQQAKIFYLVSFSSLLIGMLIIYLNYLDWSSFKYVNQLKAFSLSYFQQAISFYLPTLMGKMTSFLWLRYPLSSVVFNIFNLLVLMMVVFWKKKLRGLKGFELIYFAHLPILFMYFYLDARFLITTIVLNIIFLCLLIKALDKKRALIIAVLGLGFFGLIINQRGLYKQIIGQNLLGNSTAWHHRSVLNVGQFMADKDGAVMVTALHPPLFSLYGFGQEQLLPISATQEYFSDGIWGEINPDIIAEVQSRVIDGQAVYVSNAYITAVPDYVKAFELIGQQFNLKLEKSGCLEACNIYSISLL